jgi:hypothetical protein
MPPSTPKKADTPATATVKPGEPEPKLTLDDALAKLAFARRADVQTAMQVYREHGLRIADGKALTEAGYAALSHAIQTLGLDPADLKADVLAVQTHRARLAAAADAQAAVDSLTAASKGWKEREDALRKELQAITTDRGRMQATGQLIGQIQSEANQLAQGCPRLLGTFEQATDSALAGPKGKLHAPQVIRNAPIKDGTVPYSPGPFLGTLG